MIHIVLTVVIGHIPKKQASSQRRSANGLVPVEGTFPQRTAIRGLAKEWEPRIGWAPALGSARGAFPCVSALHP